MRETKHLLKQVKSALIHLGHQPKHKTILFHREVGGGGGEGLQMGSGNK